MNRRPLALLGVAALAAAAFTPALPLGGLLDGAQEPLVQLAAGPTTDAAAPAEHVQEDFVLESFDGTEIHYTIFRPAGSDAANPVPLVFSSHGWAGSRTTNMTGWLDAGFGGLSFDQRGFGQSGDLANIEDPELEGRDIAGLLDVVQSLDWVQRDVDATEDGVWGLDDPTVFATGGSYGGGYQTVGALTELATHGETRFDALAPEITWNDLPDTLGPSGVARSAWLTLLYAAGIGDVPDHIHRGYVLGATTGLFPDGTIPEPVAPNLVEILGSNGPKGFAEGSRFTPEGGVRLSIPALWRQGSSDTLFNLTQGLRNLEEMTDEAREGSYLIGYNGGHVLPTVLPMGTATGDDPCSAETAAGSFTELSRAFFRLVAAGESTVGFLDHRYGIADSDGSCVWTDDVRSTTAFPAGVDLSVSTGTASTTGLGVPQYLPLLTAEDEPVVVAGAPTLDATWVSGGVDQRLFFGLAKGTSELDATVVQHQMMPHRELLPSAGHEVDVELGAVGVTVQPGETLYLVVSPFVELFFGHGSARTPGVVALQDITVQLPVQGDGDGEDPGDGGDGEDPGDDEDDEDEAKDCGRPEDAGSGGRPTPKPCRPER